MTRILAMAAATAMVVAPLAAQAAPSRMAAPVASEAEEIGGSPFILPILIALAVGLGIILLTDGDDDDLPTSP